MKNLYIFWDEPLNITGGGIHRTINVLLQNLPYRGINAYYLYTLDQYHTFHFINENNCEVVMNRSELRKFLIEHKCDMILGQEGVFSATFTKMAVELKLDNVKILNQYHSSLLYFDKKLTRYYLGLEWMSNKGIMNKIGLAIRFLSYPLWKYKVRKTQAAIYRYNYENCDLSIILTKNEIPIMKRITGRQVLPKCVAIPNPLSWEHIATPEILIGKKKEVLIVSRIYNSEKRIDLALKVWRILQNKGITHDWTLRIVGEGVHKEYLMKMARHMKLKNVIWEGRCNPVRFYQTASIFLLTSSIEGWALTLTESMQLGAVPLAFDTYPAVRDIITNGENGFLIANKDIKGMANRVAFLIRNDTVRNKMALNGLKSCQRFSIDKIMDLWANLLKNL